MKAIYKIEIMEMMKSSNGRILKIEIGLRVLSLVLLVSTSCIAGLNTETEMVFAIIRRKATVKDLNALLVLVIVEAVVAGYNLLQLSRCFFVATKFKGSPTVFYPKLAWICFILDQIAAYVSFATNSAATQASLLAVTGVNSFQWLKLCDIYKRFCVEIGAALFCGLVASILMSVISSISAFNLFRHYSSKDLLVFKPLK